MDSLAAGTEGHEHGVVTEPVNNEVETLEEVNKIVFSPNWPTRPIRSSSQDVTQSQVKMSLKLED